MNKCINNVLDIFEGRFLYQEVVNSANAAQLDICVDEYMMNNYALLKNINRIEQMIDANLVESLNTLTTEEVSKFSFLIDGLFCFVVNNELVDQVQKVEIIKLKLGLLKHNLN